MAFFLRLALPLIMLSAHLYGEPVQRDVEYGRAPNGPLLMDVSVPEGKGPFPAALLITGSGAQDRDETIMSHRLFAVIADDLTRKGYIVLRVDDRGVGKSTGNFANSTSEDFAKDVNNSINYLLSRKEVNKNKVGLIGHS